MKINSIKSKILALVMVSIVASFLILGIYNAKNHYSSEYNIIKNNSLTLAKETSKFVNSYLQAKIDIIEAVAQGIQKDKISANNEIVTNKLLLAKNAGNFVDVYIGFHNDGSLVLSNKRVLNIEKDKYDSRTRGWYKSAIKDNKSGVSDPYVDVNTKKLVVSVYTPLYQNEKLIGVVGSDIFIDTIVNTVLNVELNRKGLMYLTNKDEKIIIHKDKKLLNKKDTQYKQIKNNKKLGYGETINNSQNKLVSFDTIKETNWKVLVQFDKNAIDEEINSLIYKEVLLYVVLLFIILALILFSLIKILSPLKIVEKGLNYFFRYLKGEESTISKLNIKTNDEFGNMALMIDKEMAKISESLEKDKELINNVKNVVAKVKEGNLGAKVEESTSNKSLEELKNILNEMIETISINVNKDINPILEQLKEYSELNFVNNIPNANGNISKGLNNLCNIINQMLQENKLNGLALDDSSKNLLQNVDILNKSSNETAVSLEETAASIEEITSTIVNNTNRIAEMSKHSDELSQSIKKGQELASSTVTSMDEINEQTKAIADAITIIDQISFQTNILSLNAAVEAATAGEAGKGFAVVAQEVRNLASRSAEAAKEIKDLVENATNKTNSGKQIADQMISGYEKLNENILKTTEAITDIEEASKEQKHSIEQINDVVNRLDQQSQNNASVASQTHQIAENTSKLALKILENVEEKEFRDN